MLLLTSLQVSIIQVGRRIYRLLLLSFVEIKAMSCPHDTTDSKHGSSIEFNHSNDTRTRIHQTDELAKKLHHLTDDDKPT
jgi:hypothetical protein